MIQDIVVEHEGAEYRYRDVCAKWAGHCRSVLRQIRGFSIVTSSNCKSVMPLYFRE